MSDDNKITEMIYLSDTTDTEKTSLLKIDKPVAIEDKEEYLSWCKQTSKKYWLPFIAGGVTTIIGIPTFLYIGGALLASGSVGITSSIAIKLSGIFGSFGLGAYTGKKYADIEINDPNIWHCILYELDISKIRKKCNMIQADFKLNHNDVTNFIYIILHDIKNPIYQIIQLHEYIFIQRINHDILIDMRDLLRNIYSLIFHIYNIQTDDIYLYDNIINEIDRIIIGRHYKKIMDYCDTTFKDEVFLFNEQFFTIKNIKLPPYIKNIREDLILNFRKIEDTITPIDKANVIYDVIYTLEKTYTKHNQLFTTDDLLDNLLYILHQSTIENIFIQFKYMNPFLSHKKDKYGYIITNFEMLIEYILHYKT